MFQDIYLVYLPALGHQRIRHGWGRGSESHITIVLCTWGRLQDAMTNTNCILQTVRQPNRDSMGFYWAELSVWDKENDESFCLLAPWCLVPLCPGPVVIIVKGLRPVPNQDIPGSQVGLPQSALVPGAQRCQAHLGSAWGSPATGLCRIGLQPPRILPALGQALCRK